MVPHQGAEYCRGYVNLNLNESNACEVTHKQTFSDCVSKSEGKQEKILHDVPKCPTKMMMFGVTPFPPLDVVVVVSRISDSFIHFSWQEEPSKCLSLSQI